MVSVNRATDSRYSSCASRIQTMAPAEAKTLSVSKFVSRKSICPGRSHIWKFLYELQQLGKQAVSGPAKTYYNACFLITIVIGMNTVSVGGSL